MAAATRRAALYMRVSTSDHRQTVGNQRQPLQEAAPRFAGGQDWMVAGSRAGPTAQSHVCKPIAIESRKKKTTNATAKVSCRRIECPW